MSGAALLLAACVPQGDIATSRIDQRTDRSPMGMGLDNRDFTEAAGELVRDMLDSGRLERSGGGRYVLAISRIRNDTQLRLNTDELISKVRIDLNNSGRTITTTAVGLGGPEDPLAMQTRQLRQSGEFNQRTVAGRGQMVAPDLSLSGSIIQRNNRVDGGAMRIDYTFRLVITDIRTGLAFWEGERVISRLGSGRTVAW
jgi:uncharacterized protein (TIGR02722 family)